MKRAGPAATLLAIFPFDRMGKGTILQARGCTLLGGMVGQGAGGKIPGKSRSFQQ